MGNETNYQAPSTNPQPAKANQYPHIPVANGTVTFYATADGKNGAPFIPQFSARMKDGKFVLTNASFDCADANDNEIAFDDKMFAATYGPMVLTTAVFLTLDDYRTNKSIPLGDVHGALCQ